MSSHEGEKVVHRTRGGRYYRIDANRLVVLEARAAAVPLRFRVLGVLAPLVLAAVSAVIQLRLADDGQGLTESLLAQHGLSAQSLSEGWFVLVKSLFVHSDFGAMAFNLTALVVFGLSLGFRRGWVIVLSAWLGGGVVGGLTGLAAGLAAGSPVFLASSTAVWGVVGASVLTGPRFHDGPGWAPWNLILGWIFVVLFAVLELKLFSAAPGTYAPYMAGFAAGLAAAVLVADQRHRDEFRLSAVAFVLAMVFFFKILERVAAMVQGAEGALAFGVWPALLFDLFVFAVGSFYVLVQAEYVGDLKRHAHHGRLDDLVAVAGERTDSWS